MSELLRVCLELYPDYQFLRLAELGRYVRGNSYKCNQYNILYIYTGSRLQKNWVFRRKPDSQDVLQIIVSKFIVD